MDHLEHLQIRLYHSPQTANADMNLPANDNEESYFPFHFAYVRPILHHRL